MTGYRINVFNKKNFPDTRGVNLAQEISAWSHRGIAVSFKTAKSFFLKGPLDLQQADKLGAELFSDPIVEDFFVNDYAALSFDAAIEVAYLPGVTDNIASTAREAASGFLGLRDLQVAYSKLYFLKGETSPLPIDKIRELTTGFLMNPLIERHSIISSEDWQAGKRFAEPPAPPAFSKSKLFETVNLQVSDPELSKISSEKILSLTLEEMKAIQAYFAAPKRLKSRQAFGLGALPTDAELEAISQTWSEHCKHKIFAAEVRYRDGKKPVRKIHSLFKTYIAATTTALKKKRKDLLSVFTDNAGVVVFDKDHAYALKVETHNSPSALDPYGGAMTGIVGVNRDILGTGLGARPIFNTDVFCFADPRYEGAIPPKLMHPSRIFKGVHRGVKDGGNESGIPTVNGAIVFDDRFLGKPLVFCGTGGLLPRKIFDPNQKASKKKPALRPSHVKNILPGQLIVMVGGRIGKDGIHGATFSSAALTEVSPTSAVQIGDPITQKKMIDFLLEARDLGLFEGITDNGAGGLSSSVGEMAKESGGCRMDLSKAPLKYPGLKPWEILISEAQERMTLSVAPKKIKALEALAAKREVEVSVIGEFTKTGIFHIAYGETTVAYLEMSFLHDGLPKLVLDAEWKTPVHPKVPESILQVKDHDEVLKKILARPNVASKEFWVRQYDHEVQARTVVKPFEGTHRDGPSDAAVIRPVYSSQEGLVVACGLAPRYSDLDARAMTLASVDEAVRNIVATGGDPETLTGLDNFCWPDPVAGPDNPDGAFKMAQLVRSNEALQEICLAYGIPLISGKDSMKNDYGKGTERISVPPTLLFTAAAKIPDVRLSVTTPFKKTGSAVYLIGSTKRELGGSEFLSAFGHVGNEAPTVDFKNNLKQYKAFHKAVRKGLVRSAHDLSDGGLGVAIAEMCFGGMIGVELDLAKVPGAKSLSAVEALYSESQGRILAEVAPENQKAFEALFKSLPFAKIGATVPGTHLRITQGKDRVLASSLAELKETWQKTLVF